VKTVNDEVWASVEAHFDALRQLAAAERAAGLEAIADPEVRREVASLLEHAGEGTTVAAVVGSMAAGLEPSLPGEHMGVYRLVRRLGQGGQGAVFEAVRDDGRFQQRVAIKIVKWEIDSEPARRRFRDERQILAGLDHPYIARLLDGGETRAGAPYLAMEFIDGLPLVPAAEGWSTRRKLELFLKIAEAVAAAHRKLIVHRDLKPANILVTADGSPKLLDFGIAKLLDTSDSTQTGHQMFTPDYASPEQVRGMTISTASDVYSLGVILYQLLTGRKPYHVETATPLEMDRVICQEPPPPAGLDSELDAVLAMAMRKEPERRYPGVEALADDIRRYLDRRPILARPDTVSYRTRKYVRRHWIGLLAAAIAMGGIVGGAGVAIYQARRAERQFNDVRQLAGKFLFDFHDAIAGVEGTTKARQLVVSTALQYLERLGRDADKDPGLERELAAAYVRLGRAQGFPGEPNLGRIADARASLTKAVKLYEHAGAQSPEEVRNAMEPMTRLARLEEDQSNYTQSLEWSKRALALASRIPLENMTAELATDYALAHVDMNETLESQGDGEAGYQMVREGERLLNRYAELDRSGHFDRRPVALLAQIDTAARLTGRLEEALAASEELLQKQGFTRAARAFHDARVSELYASIDQPSWDDPSKALPLVLATVQNLERTLRTDPDDINTKYSLAVNNSKIGYYLLQSDPRRAVEALTYTINLFEGMARQDPTNDEYPGRLARYRARMALARSYLHERTAVEALTSQVIAYSPKTEGQDRLHLLNLCGLALANVGKAAEASQAMQGATGLARDLLAKKPVSLPTDIEATRAFEQQAEFLRRSGDTAQAKQLLEESREVWNSREPTTTYVRLRRARADRLVAALRSGAPLH
jgi:eukaryotic-like serine/threonine-protein kinase